MSCLVTGWLPEMVLPQPRVVEQLDVLAGVHHVVRAVVDAPP